MSSIEPARAPEVRRLLARVGSLRTQPTRRIRDLLGVVRALSARGAAPSVQIRAVPTAPAIRAFLARIRDPLAMARQRGDYLNIWEVAGLKRREVANAAVLAWALNPRGSHGLGRAVLDGLAALIVQRRPGWQMDATQLSEARVTAEERPLGSDRDRVDIVVDALDFLLFVEVKIDAAEGERQLQRYAESAAARAATKTLGEGTPPSWLVVFLSPRPPSADEHWIVHITWSELSNAMLKVVRGLDCAGSFAVRSFASHIRAFS